MEAQINVIEKVANVLPAYRITVSGIEQVSRRKQKTSFEAEQITNNLDEEILNDEDVFPEGKEKTLLHKMKERNPKAIKAKKDAVMKECGKLECEVCGFDFAKIYGILGYYFAECHHKIPICKIIGDHKTRLEDLAIVCSNCHRMLHRARPLLSIPALRNIIMVEKSR